MDTGLTTSGGEGGIRTLGTGVSPYNGLAEHRADFFGSVLKHLARPHNHLNSLTWTRSDTQKHCQASRRCWRVELVSKLDLRFFAFLQRW